MRPDISPELDALRVPFTFVRRPDPLPADLRPHWRLAALALILRSSRSNKASLRKLHVLSWALRSREAQERLLNYAVGKVGPSSVIVRFEPSLMQALDFAKAEGLITLEKGKTATLTSRGVALADEIRQANVFSGEIEFLENIKPHVLVKNIDTLLEWDTEE